MFVGEDEIVDVQGYNVATPEIRTDPFDVLDAGVLRKIEMVTESWQILENEDIDVRNPPQIFRHSWQNSLTECKTDERDMETDAKDDAEDDESSVVVSTRKGDSEGGGDEGVNIVYEGGIDEKVCVSLLWSGDCAGHHDACRSRETCLRCGDMEGCYHCGYGGPLYFLLRFRTNTAIIFGVLKGAEGCETYSANEHDRILWLSTDVRTVMQNIPLPIRSELEVATNLRANTILTALPALAHLPALVRTDIVPFLNYL
jgi:hypothetical protein